MMRMPPRRPDAMSTANLQNRDFDGRDLEELKGFQLGNTASNILIEKFFAKLPVGNCNNQLPERNAMRERFNPVST